MNKIYHAILLVVNMHANMNNTYVHCGELNVCSSTFYNKLV